MGATRRARKRLTRHGYYGSVRRIHQREVRALRSEMASQIQAANAKRAEHEGFSPVD